MPRWSHDDLDHIITVSDGLIGNLSYQFQRAHGLCARLHAAATADCKLAVDSLLARKLRRDARALRTLARQLDTLCGKLTVQS